MFVVIVDNAENTSNARAVLLPSEEGTTPGSTSDVFSTLVVVFADDTKKSAGRNLYCEAHVALQQHGVGCASWFVYCKEVTE